MARKKKTQTIELSEVQRGFIMGVYGNRHRITQELDQSVQAAMLSLAKDLGVDPADESIQISLSDDGTEMIVAPREAAPAGSEDGWEK